MDTKRSVNLLEVTTFAPICDWEDDNVQLLFPTHGGANINLVDAQNNFERFGATEELFVSNVRKPNDTDEKDPEWRKFNLQTDQIRDSAPEKNYFDRLVETDAEPVGYYWLKKN